MNFDLIIIGNGIFANVFLYELNKIVNKSQNFTVAKIYEENLAPNCSTRTTSTVSKNGIEEGVSELGDLLLNSFHAFEDFYHENSNIGIYKTNQFIISTNENNQKKMEKRYGDAVLKLNNNFFKGPIDGVMLDSYIVIPHEFFQKLAEVGRNYQMKEIHQYVKCFKEVEGGVEVTLLNGDVIRGKKCVVATGAYSRLFSDMFLDTLIKDKILNTKIAAGSYLIKKASFDRDIYLTINGHNLVYRQSSNELIIGSTTVEGAITLPMISELKNIYDEVKSIVNFDLGTFEEYSIETGLRHKGQKRMPYFKAITANARIWFFNGAYKNGWSLPFYLAKKEVHQFI